MTTKFENQLFDALMREHGPTLAAVRPSAGPKRHGAPRRMALAAGAGLAVAAAVAGVLVTAGGAPPAYAVTKNPDGTVSVAVYRQSGFAQANSRLRSMGDGRVVVVPIRPGCPSLPSRPPAPADRLWARVSGPRSPGGGVTVQAAGIPAKDILVIGIEATRHGGVWAGALTSRPAPSCVSVPGPPPGHDGSGT